VSTIVCASDWPSRRSEARYLPRLRRRLQWPTCCGVFALGRRTARG